MITVEQQQKLLIDIEKMLTSNVTAYAMGGTAMMFLGLKTTTLDIDLVFKTERDRHAFKEAIQAMGYQKLDSINVYGTKKNRPETFTLGKERFDLFLDEIIHFHFSQHMQKRADDNVHQFGDKLIIKVADPHDLILLKCATDRKKDIDDAQKIIENSKIRWETIIKESQNQVALGKTTAIFELGCFLEKLKESFDNTIPQATLNALFALVEKQAEEKQKTSHT